MADTYASSNGLPGRPGLHGSNQNIRYYCNASKLRSEDIEYGISVPDTASFPVQTGFLRLDTLTQGKYVLLFQPFYKKHLTIRK